MVTARQQAALKRACCDTWTNPVARLLLGDRLHPGGARTTALTVRTLGLEPGARILDLGCGYGAALEVLVEQGYEAIGLELASEAASEAAIRGDVVVADAEQPPIREESLDGMVIECVLSLLPHKDRALSHAHRLLRTGGRIAVSDVTVDHALPAGLEEVATWSACVSGALSTEGYLRLLRESGFDDIQTVVQDDELTALIEQIRRRISLIEIALTAGGVDLAVAGLDHNRMETFRSYAVVALDAVRNGMVGYRLFHAMKQ